LLAVFPASNRFRGHAPLAGSGGPTGGRRSARSSGPLVGPYVVAVLVVVVVVAVGVFDPGGREHPPGADAGVDPSSLLEAASSPSVVDATAGDPSVPPRQPVAEVTAAAVRADSSLRRDGRPCSRLVPVETRSRSVTVPGSATAE